MSIKVVMPHSRHASDGSCDPVLLIGGVEEVRCLDIEEAVFWVTNHKAGDDVPRGLMVAWRKEVCGERDPEKTPEVGSMPIPATRMFYDFDKAVAAMDRGEPLPARVVIIGRTGGRTDQLAATTDHSIYLLNDKGDTIQRLL
jgi:thiamine pyrophosphokinase